MPEKDNLSILILDDEPSFNEELVEFIDSLGYKVRAEEKPHSALEYLKENVIDILILDIKLPQMSGIEVLKIVHNEFPDLEVIMVTGHGDMETVIEALRLGAIDFLKKPFRHLDIKLAIERTRKYLYLSRKLKRVENQSSLLSRELQKRVEYDLIGHSASLRQVYELAMTSAQFGNSNVLVTGESGSGKEIIARLIHYASPRKDNNFCPVNCSAIPDSLLESEFFGHKKGSFTGAISDRKGYFELADQGTIFLDEIGDMPIELQAKLLRAIESKKIKKIGDQKEYRYDFRIISATNRNVNDLVKSNSFRLDLLHRLNTIEIFIPPLRQRIEDIKPLVEYFTTSLAGQMNLPRPEFSEAALNKLKKYSFPGNVRELKNLIERAFILNKGKELRPEHFLLSTTDELVDSAELADMGNLNLDEHEKKLIMLALEKNLYNQQKTADDLGISRHSLSRRLKKFELVPENQ
ncbi:MAG: sigma-54 dependent transcriptional regulator [Candidatus Cloacimonetes bacterium]|nr:sigma-54 dependent transcriptional regulator [Candidatus Cloacimonadota bacterium]